VSFSAHANYGSGRSGAAVSITLSVALHVGLVAAFLTLRPEAVAPPPFYRVNLVAARASEAPAAGVVAPPATKAPPPTTKAPPRPKSEEVVPIKTADAPKVTDKRATPSVSDTRVPRNTPAPVAGGGPEGGAGADVGNIKTEGIEFPYTGYLENIVRQIRLRFKPPAGMAALTAEVAFLIRRDGTIMQFRFTKNSRSFTFDLEVQGAVEAAAEKFGPLPAGWKDDVLPVVFSFDPRLIR
jgi:outer membrane biosynthesis protein TonB